MKGVFVRRTFGLLLAVSAVAGVASEAVARTRFDGLWSVSIVTYLVSENANSTESASLRASAPRSG